jgi:hypothetical protein
MLLADHKPLHLRLTQDRLCGKYHNAGNASLMPAYIAACAGVAHYYLRGAIGRRPIKHQRLSAFICGAFPVSPYCCSR